MSIVEMEKKLVFIERESVFGLPATGPPLGGSRIGREGVRGQREAKTVFR